MIVKSLFFSLQDYYLEFKLIGLFLYILILITDFSKLGGNLVIYPFS